MEQKRCAPNYYYNTVKIQRKQTIACFEPVKLYVIQQYSAMNCFVQEPHQDGRTVPEGSYTRSGVLSGSPNSIRELCLRAPTHAQAFCPVAPTVLENCAWRLLHTLRQVVG
jgi:hypothetical protein